MPDPAMNVRGLSAQRALPGWYGKLPGAGDFVDRRMPRELAQAWEQWFARGIASMMGRAGHVPSDGHAPPPIWRFAIPAGAGAGWVQFGCIAPSRDRVGRRYPLLAAHVLELNGFTRGEAVWASASLPAIGDALEEAIRGAFGPEDFDALLARRMAVVSTERADEIGTGNGNGNGWPNLLDYFDPDGMTSFWWIAVDDDESSSAQAHTGALDSALLSTLFSGASGRLPAVDG